MDRLVVRTLDNRCVASECLLDADPLRLRLRRTNGLIWVGVVIHVDYHVYIAWTVDCVQDSRWIVIWENYRLRNFVRFQNRKNTNSPLWTMPPLFFEHAICTIGGSKCCAFSQLRGTPFSITFAAIMDRYSESPQYGFFVSEIWFQAIRVKKSPYPRIADLPDSGPKPSLFSSTSVPTPTFDCTQQGFSDFTEIFIAILLTSNKIWFQGIICTTVALSKNISSSYAFCDVQSFSF